MLSKQVCKKCIKKYRFHSWNKYDDMRWNEGFVLCPHVGFGKSISHIIYDPPYYCKYALEHIMEDQ